jgi:hypothetical protein
VSDTKADNVIRFSATIARVQTLADGGLRVILDMPEAAVKSASVLMEARQAGAFLEVAAVPVFQKVTVDGSKPKQRRNNSSRSTTRKVEINE